VLFEREDWYNPGAKGSLCAPEPHAADATVPLCWSGAWNICSHGTHVAGIAAGSHTNATVAYDGVAPGADIIAIQVFSYFEDYGDVLSWNSDQLLALERVYEMSFSYNIAAVNMSLGGADRYTDHCDSDPRKAAIDNLRSVGIATIVAAGNEGYTDGVSAPACVSSAVAVGGTRDDDALWGCSNSSEMVHLLAPGVGVNSSIPDNAYAGKKRHLNVSAPRRRRLGIAQAGRSHGHGGRHRGRVAGYRRARHRCSQRRHHGLASRWTRPCST